MAQLKFQHFLNLCLPYQRFSGRRGALVLGKGGTTTYAKDVSFEGVGNGWMVGWRRLGRGAAFFVEVNRDQLAMAVEGLEDLLHLPFPGHEDPELEVPPGPGELGRGAGRSHPLPVSVSRACCHHPALPDQE